MTTRPEQAGGMLRRMSLDSAGGLAWTVEAARDLPRAWEHLADIRHPATVPGEVYADLLTAGLIPDPFDGTNETELAWIGRTDWVYRTTFEWPGGPEARHDLVAEGLDTVATVTLNGHRVGHTANQHRSYRFDITDGLAVGTNELTVAFEAPVRAAHRLADELGDRPRVLGHPYNAIRKMAAGFGWDWGPDLAGVGIWRPIRIESWSGARIASVRPLARVDGVEGHLLVHVDLEWAGDSGNIPVEVVATLAGGLVAAATLQPGERSAALTVRVPQVRRWWPVGYGEQPLYDLRVEVAGNIQWTGRVGFRNVTVTTQADEHGTDFTLAVNDQPVFVKGANWIPDDALLTRLDADTYAASIADAAAAGLNLLRVWGGGLYESEDFYRVCDERGILVWQDFAFACAAYAEEEPLRGEVEAEAREAVTRLSQHASLALWNGNNENIWGWVDWGWRPQLQDRSWGEGYYTDLLPRIVAELDPRTPYSPASPFSFAPYHHPNDPRHGTMHVWDVWNDRDYRHYRDYPARFVSEFGFQGPPAWSTLAAVVHDEPSSPYGPQLLVHQKAADGNVKLERGLGDHLPHWRDDPVDMDDWHWTTSLNQARAVAYGVEHFRSLFPVNSGSIVWQLNDNWPVISWAAVDAAGIRKPLWHALRRVSADRFATVQPRDGVQALVLHNDHAEPWSGDLTVTRRSTGLGTGMLAEQRIGFTVDPRSAVTLDLDPEVRTPGSAEGEVLAVAVPGAPPVFGYFVEDTSLALLDPTEAWEVAVSSDDAGYAVTVTAHALAKDVCVFPDRLDPAARVDTGLVTLLAGQRHTFVVTGADLDEVALTTAPVLRSVNDLIGGSG